MKRRSPGMPCLALGVALLVLTSRRASSAEDVVEKVSAALKERQNAVRTLKIKWTETRFYSKESGTASGEDQTFRRTITVWLDGAKARCEYSGQSPHARAGVVGHTQFTVTDGKLLKTYEKFSHQERAWGRWSEGARPFDFRETGFQPFLLCLRPRGWQGTIDFSPRGWHLTSPRRMVNGEPCVVFNSGDERRQESMALSLDKDYAFLQYARLVRGRVILQVDIAHQKDAVYGWVPRSWRWVEVNSATGNILSSVSAGVEELEINREIPTATFELEFPPGTILTDRNAGVNLLVGEDGTRKRVVVDTDARVIRSLEGWSGRQYVLLGSAVTFVVLVVWIVWRRHGLSRRASGKGRQ